MLGQFPATLELLKIQGARYFQHLKRTDPNAYDLTMAVDHYRTNGDYILMNAIACGHRTLRGFLNATMPDRYQSDEHVEQWSENFLRRYGGISFYEADDVRGRFDNHDELQQETRGLDTFLRAGPPLSDVCMIKGISEIMSDEASTMSTQVNGRDYVRAFLMNQPIMYDSFLSTTFDPREAEDFAGGNPASKPKYVIDFADTTGKSEVFRQHALADLNNNCNSNQTSSIMLVVRAKAARGKVIDGSAALGIGDEKEVLLSLGHVLMPSMAIRCDEGYVLFADAYHRDFVR